MGRAKKLKELRKIARKMPPITTTALAKEIVDAKTLINQDIREVDGKPVNDSQKYIQSKVVRVPINHSRNMKKEFFKNGNKGVVGYMKSVEHFILSQKLKEDEQTANTGEAEINPGQGEDIQPDLQAAAEVPAVGSGVDHQ